MLTTQRIYVAEDTPEDALILEAVLQRPGGRQLRFFSDGLALYRAVRQDPRRVRVLAAEQREEQVLGDDLVEARAGRVRDRGLEHGGAGGAELSDDRLGFYAHADLRGRMG